MNYMLKLEDDKVSEIFKAEEWFSESWMIKKVILYLFRGYIVFT